MQKQYQKFLKALIESSILKSYTNQPPTFLSCLLPFTPCLLPYCPLLIAYCPFAFLKSYNYNPVFNRTVVKE